MLERGKHLMFTERFGQIDPQGKNKTKTCKWRRFEALARATAPLAEGVTPPGQIVRVTDVEVTLEQYGDWVQITDVIADTHEDPVLDQMATVCGEQAAETVEVVRIAVLKAGTNVYFPGTATTRATVNSILTRGVIRKIIRGFKRNKGSEITQLIKASALIGTEAVAPAFWMMGHTDLASDIRGINGFVPTEQYADSSKGIDGEAGKIEGMRFLLSALWDPWYAAGVVGTSFLSGGSAVTVATACDVYPLVAIARNAYGIVPLAGSNAITPAVANPKVGIGDPLGQRGFVSWKTMQAAVILQQLWVARAEVACTANPT
jgi:N4-gp56 family major capsid protein